MKKRIQNTIIIIIITIISLLLLSGLYIQQGIIIAAYDNTFTIIDNKRHIYNYTINSTNKTINDNVIMLVHNGYTIFQYDDTVLSIK